MEQWTSSVARTPHGGPMQQQRITIQDSALYTSHQHTTNHRAEPMSLCGLPSQRGHDGHLNQVLSLSGAPPAHRGGVGHPKHGGYAKTRVGDQRDKKSSGKDRSCSTQEANDSEVAGETEDNVARKGPGWPDAVGSSIPPLSWILEVGGDHHTR